MKKLFSILLTLIGVAAFGQPDYYAKTVRFASGIDTTTVRPDGTVFYNHVSNKLRIWEGGVKATIWPVTATGGSGALTVGTTTITSGTNTRILYNNSGILGEYTISGSGNVAMTTSPVFTTPNIGSATGSISGNAGTATALATGRTISISGDLTYTSPSFDGSGNVTAAGTLATVNGNVGTFGSATQATQLTVNAKGLITAVSNVTVTPAVGSITGLGSNVATWLATPSYTNFLAAITGTSPYWNLGSGGSLTGVNTITSNTSNQYIGDGAWTATGAADYQESRGGTFTSRPNASDVLYPYRFVPTTISDATNSQTIGNVLIGGTINLGDANDESSSLLVNPTFTGNGSASARAITAMASHSSSLVGMKLINTGSGNVTFSMTALSGATIGTGGQFSIIRGNGANNSTTIRTTGTGAFDIETNGSNQRVSIAGSTGNLTLTNSGTVVMTTSSAGVNIIGTNTNNNASAGYYGENTQSLVASGSAVSLTTATPANVTSISLTAGDWDVQGIVNFILNTATVTQRSAGSTSTSATIPTDGTEGTEGAQFTLISATDGIPLPAKRFSLSGTTTVYLVASATFSSGTVTAFGYIKARRAR